MVRCGGAVDQAEKRGRSKATGEGSNLYSQADPKKTELDSGMPLANKCAYPEVVLELLQIINLFPMF